MKEKKLLNKDYANAYVTVFSKICRLQESFRTIEEFYDLIIRYSLELMTVENINLKRSLIKKWREKMSSVKVNMRSEFVLEWR